MARDAVIALAVRTPIGKRGGALAGWHPADLSGHVLEALAQRSGIDPALVDDVVWGCVNQAGEQALNIGRSAVLAAGWPESVPATTVDRQCGSSQQAIHFAAAGVISGQYDIAVAGGVESMTRVPMGSNTAHGPGIPFGPKALARYDNVLFNQGVGAEMIAKKLGPVTHAARRVQRQLAREGDRGDPWRPLRGSGHPGACDGRGRRRLGVRHRSGRAAAEARSSRWPSSSRRSTRRTGDHGGQRLADLRRCGRAVGHHFGAGRASWASSRWSGYIPPWSPGTTR